MASQDQVIRLRSELEARLLQVSFYATLLIAGLGVLFGLLARSPAVLFDGLFSLVDAAITWLTLAVARLVASQGDHRFQYGFWHLEPLVSHTLPWQWLEISWPGKVLRRVRFTVNVRSQAILAWRRRGWNSQGWKP